MINDNDNDNDDMKQQNAKESSSGADVNVVALEKEMNNNNNNNNKNNPISSCWRLDVDDATGFQFVSLYYSTVQYTRAVSTTMTQFNSSRAPFKKVFL